MDVSVIKSYLVSLGFKVDNRQLGLFNEGLKKAARVAGEATGEITKGFLVAGATITGVLAGIAAGTVGMALHVADADLDMQLFARRMFLSTDAARKMKTATDALGYSIEEIVWGPPELAERYRQLIKDQNKMLSALGGADFEKQMRNLRDVRFEFTRLSVEMRYFTMLVVADLSKALFGDENALLGKLQKFSDWFMANMPRIAENIATKIAPSFHIMGEALGHLWETLSKVDWAGLFNTVAKITTALVKVLDFIVSHPLLAQTLLGAAGGAAAGSIIPGVGTALGAAGGAIGMYTYGAMGKVLGAGNGGSNSASIQQQIIAGAKANGIDPALALAVARQESGFNPGAINSSSGAMGLFQLMPKTATGLGVTNAFDPGQNIDAGTRYLRDLLAKNHGDVGAALKEYGGFVTTDPSGYINSVERYRRQYEYGTGGGSVQPMAFHSTVNIGDINIPHTNATPDQIHGAVRDAVESAQKRQIAVLLTQRQGSFA